MQGAARSEAQRPVLHAHTAVGRNDVNTIGRDRVAVLNGGHRQAGAARQDFREMAFELRGQMRDEHDRHAGIRRQRVQELLERAQPARGSADGDDGKRLDDPGFLHEL